MPTIRSFARFAPTLAVFALAAAGCDSAQRQAEMQGETRALRAEMQRMVDAAEKGESASPGSLAAGPMPDGEEARAMWILRRLMSEIPVYVDSLSKEHGVNVNVLPAAWQTPEYLAGASSHPEVRDYFVRYGAYLAEAGDGMRLRTHARMKVMLAEAGLGSEAGERMLAGFERTYPESASLMRHTGEAVRAAIAYHDFLASVDPRVSVSGSEALFERDDELSRAQALEGRMMTLFQQVAAEQQAATLRAQARMDSVDLMVGGGPR